MARVVVAPRADEDLDDIIAYLDVEAGPATADKYTALIEAVYAQIADYPESGALRPKLGDAVRIGIVAPYIVIYEYMAATDTVTVLRIVHGSRRITNKLLTR